MGMLRLFSISNDGSTASSLPTALRYALVHRTRLGFFFFWNAL